MAQSSQLGTKTYADVAVSASSAATADLRYTMVVPVLKEPYACARQQDQQNNASVCDGETTIMDAKKSPS